MAVNAAYKNPCYPSPCGPNSECRFDNNKLICSCQKDFIGTSPHCHPECVSNSDCRSNQNCLNNKCSDPCTSNPCGSNANCRTENHLVSCICAEGSIGNPFDECRIVKGESYFRGFGNVY